MNIAHEQPRATSRPWLHLVDEERDGHWADFAAWQGWLRAEIDRRVGDVPCDPHWLDDMDPTVQVHLYCLMCDQSDAALKLVEEGGSP